MFTADTWSAVQTVKVNVADDDIDEAAQTAAVTHRVSGGDYDSVTATGVTVTVTDNDERGVTVSMSSLRITEGGSGMYTVVLKSAPTADVTIGVSEDGDDVSVSSTSLTFTPSDWSTAQPITVSAAEDADGIEDAATITHMVSGGDYGLNSVAAESVSVTVQDNDVAGVAVSPPSLTVNEGATDTYTVKLNTQPSASVTVTPSGNASVSVSPAVLTFTTTNWGTEQPVTVTANQDLDGEDVTVTITHAVSGYGSIRTAAPVTVTVDDDDVPSVRVFPTSLPPIAEGSTGSYAVVLDTQPVGNVTVTPRSDNGDVRVSQALRFTTTNWDTAQIFTVTAREDGDAVNDMAKLTHAVSGYGSVTTADSVDVTVTDDDTAGVTVSVEDLMIDEGRTGMYTVVLDTEPAVNVTIGIMSDNSDVTTNTNQLTFTMGNWRTAQTVTVTAGEDGDDMDDSATISHMVMGYVGVTTVDSVDVTVTDDDTPGVSVSETSLRFDEGGSGTYTVVLDTEPTGSVTVTVSSDNTEVEVTPASLTFTVSDTFTVSNWNNPQEVTVSADRDGDRVGEEATISHAVSGYGSITTAGSVDVAVTDLDRAGVTVSTTSLQISEGGMETYTLVLNAAPIGTVEVAIASANPDVTAFPATLTFTVVNWATEQTVTVSAAEDNDSSNDTSRLTHSATSADTGYQGITISGVTVTVTDNDSTSQQSTGGGGGGGFGPAPTAPKFVDGFRVSRPLAVNARPGDAVGDPVAATHPNDDVTYSLSGADAALFTVDAETGQMRLGQGVTLELGRTYTVNLTGTDSSGTGAIIIVVIEVGEGVGDPYDLNRNGMIEKDEVLDAVSDYFAGLIEKDEVLALVTRYFAV